LRFHGRISIGSILEESSESEQGEARAGTSRASEIDVRGFLPGMIHIAMPRGAQSSGQGPDGRFRGTWDCAVRGDVQGLSVVRAGLKTVQDICYDDDLMRMVEQY
jgi:hypothetical protein